MRVVAIGASAGGSQALAELLRHLPADYPWPVLVVKHQQAESGEELVKWLSARLPLKVKLALDKMPAMAGDIVIAPPDYHLLLNPDGAVSLSQDEPVSYARPSVDVLFESVADACAAEAVGVVLTGASRDGAAGARAIRKAGGRVLVQNPETSEVGVMPRAALVDDAQGLGMELEQLTRQLLALAADDRDKLQR